MVSDDLDPHDLAAIQARIRARAASEEVSVTRHAEDALFEDGFTKTDLLHALTSGVIIENYPEFYKGPCCLLYGDTSDHRPMHIICSTTSPLLVIITVYEPTLPKWITPTRRRG